MENNKADMLFVVTDFNWKGGVVGKKQDNKLVFIYKDTKGTSMIKDRIPITVKHLEVENLGQYTIVGRLADLTNEQMESLVEKVVFSNKESEDGDFWKNYAGEEIFITAAQGLYSCIRVHGFLVEPPKPPQFSYEQSRDILIDTDTRKQQYMIGRAHV